MAMVGNASGRSVPTADWHGAARSSWFTRARSADLRARLCGELAARCYAVDRCRHWPRDDDALDPGAANGDARYEPGFRRVSRAVVLGGLVAVVVLTSNHPIQAHSGPPFPIVSDRVTGAYKISIWADPDTTDDRTAAGQFWNVLATADGRGTIPVGTRAIVSIRPSDRPGDPL